MKKIFAAWLLAACAVILITCKHKPDTIRVAPKPVPVTNPNGQTAIRDNNVIAMGCSPDSVYFQNTILPLITSSCANAGCHDAATHADGYNLTSYLSIAQNRAKMYKHMMGSGKIMPPSGKLPQAALDAFNNWNLQGAKNNVCKDQADNCDTMNVSYSKALVPLINTYCRGCHNSSLASGNVILDNYNGVLLSANNGQLMGGLTGKLTPMPQFQQPLPACTIGKFRQWIKEGAKNN